MKRTTSTWLAILAVAGAVIPAWGAMIGIGREGDFAIEVFAERSEVSRSAGTASLSLPRDAEGLFLAADVRMGDGVWTGDGGAKGSAPASVVVLKPGWFSCELKLKEAVRPASVPVERFHLLPWKDLGGRFVKRLDGLARGKEAAYQEGLADVLAKTRTVFGGQSMVEGFPGTKYAAVFAGIRRAFDRCVRKGQMRGFSDRGDLRSEYRAVFGDEWPEALPVAFLSGDGRPLEIRRIADADGRPLPDVFDSPLPIRLEGDGRVDGIFPAGTDLRIVYAVAGDAGAGEQTVHWSAAAGDGAPLWFMLQAVAPGEGAGLSTYSLENAGAVAVAVRMEMGGLSRTCTLPASGRIRLCRVTGPGSAPLSLHGEPDPSDPFARDWSIVPSKESDSVVRLDAVRKAAPELVLNNPEMMPVDVTITPAGGGRGSQTKVTLKAGETGVGVSVPAHKALAVGYAFRSDFHNPGRTDIPALYYGERSNLVLRATLKGTTSKAAPKATAKAPARLPPPVAARPPEKAADVPQIVLRNAGGTMDVEATLMSAEGRPVAKPVIVKRGAASQPIALPGRSGLYFRIVYGNSRSVPQKRLVVPAVRAGEIKVVDIPDSDPAVRRPAPAGSKGPTGDTVFF